MLLLYSSYHSLQATKKTYDYMCVHACLHACACVYVLSCKRVEHYESVCGNVCVCVCLCMWEVGHIHRDAPPLAYTVEGERCIHTVMHMRVITSFVLVL